MSAIYGELDRRVFTGVGIRDVPGVICNHDYMASLINNKPVESVTMLPYCRREGIPLSPDTHTDSFPGSARVRIGEKHFYTCILVQGKIHTLFAYESYDYMDTGYNTHVFSRFLPPNDADVRSFLKDEIIY